MEPLTASYENDDRPEFAKPATIYVLKHLQPRLEKKTTPSRYVKKTTIDLIPDKQPDLNKIIHNEIEFVVDKIHFNADWFTTGAYLNLWKKHFTEFLDENTEIQELCQTFKTNMDDIDKQFGVVIDSLKRLSQTLKTTYDQWHRKIMAEFLESDLPIELYNLYNLSYIERISAINSLVTDLTRLQTSLHLVRSDEKKIKAELKKFEKRRKKISKVLIKASRSEFIIKFFLRAVNAKELEDMFRIKPLMLNSDTERERFEEYLGEFRQSIFEMTNNLDKKQLDEDMMMNSSDSEAFKDFDKRICQTILRYDA